MLVHKQSLNSIIQLEKSLLLMIKISDDNYTKRGRPINNEFEEDVCIECEKSLEPNDKKLKRKKANEFSYANVKQCELAWNRTLHGRTCYPEHQTDHRGHDHHLLVSIKRYKHQQSRNCWK